MDARTVARWAGGVCMVVAPAALTVNFSPYGEDDPVAKQLADIAADPGALQRYNLIGVAAVLMVPAMVFVAMLARRGAARLALVGGGLSALGWLAGFSSLGGVGLLYQSAAAAPDRATAVAIIQGVVDDPIFGGSVLVFVLGHLIGMLVLGIALWRSRVVPVWVGILFAVVEIGHAVARQIGPLADAATFALLTVAMAYCAFVLVRMRNDDWDLPPVVDARSPKADAVAVA